MHPKNFFKWYISYALHTILTSTKISSCFDMFCKKNIMTILLVCINKNWCKVYLTIFPIFVIVWATWNWTRGIHYPIIINIWCQKIIWANFPLSGEWSCIQIFLTMKRIMSNRLFFSPWPNIPNRNISIIIYSYQGPR